MPWHRKADAMAVDGLATYGTRTSAVLVLTYFTNIPASVPEGLAFNGQALPHCGRDIMAVIFQTTFSNAFSWIKMYEFQLRFHWSLFLSAQLKIFQHWFRLWFGADPATSHCMEQWWLINWRICASLALNELCSTPSRLTRIARVMMPNDVT